MIAFCLILFLAGGGLLFFFRHEMPEFAFIGGWILISVICFFLVKPSLSDPEKYAWKHAYSITKDALVLERRNFKGKREMRYPKSKMEAIWVDYYMTDMHSKCSRVAIAMKNSYFECVYWGFESQVAKMAEDISKLLGLPVYPVIFNSLSVLHPKDEDAKIPKKAEKMAGKVIRLLDKAGNMFDSNMDVMQNPMEDAAEAIMITRKVHVIDRENQKIIFIDLPSGHKRETPFQEITEIVCKKKDQFRRSGLDQNDLKYEYDLHVWELGFKANSGNYFPVYSISSREDTGLVSASSAEKDALKFTSQLKDLLPDIRMQEEKSVSPPGMGGVSVPLPERDGKHSITKSLPQEPLYYVSYAGELKKNAKPHVVQERLMQILDMDKIRMNKMMEGEKTILRKNVPYSVAEKLAATLARAGALARIEPVGAASPAPGEKPHLRKRKTKDQSDSSPANQKKELYHVTFSGEITERAVASEVKKHLLKVMKGNTALVNRMMKGEKFIIKKNTSLETAKKTVHAFQNFGAIARIEAVKKNTG